MLRGDRVGLRARRESDVPILQTGLSDDVANWARAHARPWQPYSPGAPSAPYSVVDPTEAATSFSVVDLADDALVGDAQLWGIDQHNRTAHLGLSLLPDCRGRGLGSDAVRMLCHYGFVVRGLHRLQVDTLADNAAMIRAATRNGFRLEGTLRASAWVYGEFLDEVILGLLASEWLPR